MSSNQQRRLIVGVNPGSTNDEYWAADVDTFLDTGEFVARQQVPVDRNATADDHAELFEAFVLQNDQFSDQEVVVVGTRGAILPGALPGVTLITQSIVDLINAGRFATVHPCNTAPVIGFQLAEDLNELDRVMEAPIRDVRTYFADPISSVEPDYLPEATICGHPGLRIPGYAHYLNMREVIRRHAAARSIPVDQLHCILVHAGGGISVAAVKYGRIVAVNNANEAGPFTDRVGGVPTLEFLRWVYEQVAAGKQLEHLQAYLTKSCGLPGLTGGLDYPAALAKAAGGDADTKRILSAMYFHIAEEIYKRVVVFTGDATISENSSLDLVITGGMAHAPEFTEGIFVWLNGNGRFHGDVMFRYPGSFEAESLTRQVIQAYHGQVPVHEYQYPG
ncbi:MAG: hypothetical protein V1916_03035 [Patescibacteria group bacterium]